MNPIYGNHIGIVVNSNPDPEGRGRVQIFVPHLSTTLYDNWNKDAKDISITQGSLAGLNVGVLQRLQQNLPWAEYAFPLFGSGGTTYADPSTGLTRPSQSSSAPSVNISGINALGADNKTSPKIDIPLSNENVSSLNLSNQLSLNNQFPTASSTVKANAANNPGNLHIYNTTSPNSNYTGQIGITGDVKDGQYRGSIATFATMSDGIAANLNQLNKYINGSAAAAQSAGGPLDTIRKIENAWVGGDNPTAAGEVSKFSGIPIDEKIDPNNANQMMNLMAGMMRVEAGGIPANFTENFKTGFETFQQRKGLTTELSVSQNQTYTGKVLDSTRQLPGVDMRHPNGVNSFPLPGTFVWCFFLGGDIQRPVYFAGVSEKNSAARTSNIPSQVVPLGVKGNTLTGNSLSTNSVLINGGTEGTSVLTDINGNPVRDSEGNPVYVDPGALNLLAKAATNANVGSSPGGYCYSNVKNLLQAAGMINNANDLRGDSSFASAYMAADNLTNINTQGGLTEPYSWQTLPSTDVSKAPPGSVVVWDKTDSHPNGHIAIIDSSGNQVSDFRSSNMSSLPVKAILVPIKANTRA